MQLLDAALAFALTLAALATVVTMIMEFAHRALKIRKRNLFYVMQLLSTELPWLDEKEGWQFTRNVLNNPTNPDKWLPEERVDFKQKGFMATLTNWWRRGRGVYDKVTSEHVLRRLSELPVARKLIRNATQPVEAEFHRVMRRFDELRSAASSDMKRRAQMYSIILGVLFAVAANIDGARVFEEFMNNGALTEKVIAQRDELEQNHTEIKNYIEEAAALRESAADEEVEQALQKATRLLTESRETVAGLTDLGLPIGWAYYPHSELFPQGDQSSSNRQAEDSASGWGVLMSADFWGWLLRAIGTGVLIGLGAPFWFDVAKRLAQVRRMFKGEASSEDKHAGSDPAGDPKECEELVKRVIADAKEKRIEALAQAEKG